jgi:hypothetical protein
MSNENLSTSTYRIPRIRLMESGVDINSLPHLNYLSRAQVKSRFEGYAERSATSCEVAFISDEDYMSSKFSSSDYEQRFSVFDVGVPIPLDPLIANVKCEKRVSPEDAARDLRGVGLMLNVGSTWNSDNEWFRIYMTSGVILGGLKNSDESADSVTFEIPHPAERRWTSLDPLLRNGSGATGAKVIVKKYTFTAEGVPEKSPDVEGRYIRRLSESKGVIRIVDRAKLRCGNASIADCLAGWHVYSK